MDHLRRRDLLLVEDDTDFVRLIENTLQGHPQFALRSASRLGRAVDAIVHTIPDIILLDLGLPDSTGLETLSKVSALAPGVPIVILTGAQDETLEREAVIKGAQDYLQKQNFDPDLLVRALRHALERSHRARATRTRSEHLRLIVEQLPIIIWSTDSELRYTSVAGVGLSAFSEAAALEGTTMMDYLGAEHAAVADARRALCGESLTREIEWQNRVLETHTNPLRQADGVIIGVLGLAVDVTDRHEQDVKLRRSEASLANAQRIAAIGSWDLEIATDSLYWSAQVHEMFGISRAEFEASYEGFLARVHPDDRLRVHAASELARKGETRLDLEHRIVRPDGAVRVMHELGEISRDAAGQPQRLSGTVRDVTEQRQVDARLRESLRDLRALSSRLDVIREQERGRIAREVHDGLGQALTALKMDVAEVGRRLARNDRRAVEERLVEMTTLIDSAVDSVRQVSAQLRPIALDEGGLVANMRSFLDGLTRRGGHPRFVLEANMAAEPQDNERATAVFRIFQESLTNIFRHAQADTVRVSVSSDRDHLRLVVQDDGVGFSPNAAVDARSFGLTGMRDRARFFHGELTVSSTPGGGCTVTADIPLGPEPSQDA